MYRVWKRLHSFVYALLTATRLHLKIIDNENSESEITKTESGVERRQAKLASAFRKRMTEGQSYQGQNAYRKHFYQEVTQLAEEVSFP
jgi:hypothetical protein